MKTVKPNDSITSYIEGYPATKGPYEFVMDFRNQQRVTPKAAPRAGKFGKRTMNSGGRAAGPFQDEEL